MILTIDIGGTKTLILPFKDGSPALPDKFPTKKPYDEFINDLETHLKNSEVPSSVVFAIPGVIKDPYSANYTFKLGNLPWTSPAPLINCIKNLYNLDPLFINDADAATLYEASLRPASKKLIYLTFSTGIGGGIAENGRLSPESSTFEPGHTRYVHDGKDREWEDLASAEAIRLAYGKFVTEFKKDDEKALKDIASRLALGLNLIIAEHSPEDVIIGGPLSRIFPLIEPYLLPLLDVVPHFAPFSSPYSVNFGCHLYGQLSEKN